jgi:hypothetical protein
MKRVTVRVISLLTAISVVFVGVASAAYYPIIFIHGHKSEGTNEKGWETWGDNASAMQKILRESYCGRTGPR